MKRRQRQCPQPRSPSPRPKPKAKPPSKRKPAGKGKGKGKKSAAKAAEAAGPSEASGAGEEGEAEVAADAPAAADDAVPEQRGKKRGAASAGDQRPRQSLNGDVAALRALLSAAVERIAVLEEKLAVVVARQDGAAGRRLPTSTTGH